jgi:hypothetical protein
MPRTSKRLAKKEEPAVAESPRRRKTAAAVAAPAAPATKQKRSKARSRAAAPARKQPLPPLRREPSPKAKSAAVTLHDALVPAKPVQLALALTRPAPIPSRPFRTELTVEQNSLFVANNYQGEHFVRQSVVRHPGTGEDIVRRMSVGKLHPTDRARGVLRQIHQDCFYKVLELWGQQGYELGLIRGKRYGVVRTSLYELVNAIFGATDNARSYRRTRELLRDLQAIPIVLENVYTWAGLKDREEFTLLGDVSWSEKRLDRSGKPSEGGRSTATIVLSSMVTEGFQASHFKVLLGQPYEALGQGRGRRSEIARLLYPFLDTQLAENEVYEGPLDALAERFALHRYAHRSKRKEKFAPAIRALQGKPILEGNYRLRLELVAVSDDYILRAERVDPAETRDGLGKAPSGRRGGFVAEPL